jgi:GNAT superfamily N-acetyltransferase
MQRSWRIDGDKLTFIICSQDAVHTESPEENMVGDVNLFLTKDGDSVADSSVVGELELMIAEQRMRGKGLGRASLLAFLKFIILHQEDILEEYSKHGGGNKTGTLEHLRVRIGEGNKGSIGLFESLGFRKVREEANYFGEVELRIMGLVGEVVDGLMEKYRVLGYREVEYRGEV